MKAIKFFLILIIIGVLAAGGYYGANLYAKNKALKTINKIIKDEHLESLVDYDDVEADIFSHTITIKHVKFSIQNQMTAEDVGIIKCENAVIDGSWNKDYRFRLNNISFINLNPQSPPKLIDKEIAKAAYAVFDIEKQQGITSKFVGKIEGIRLSRLVFAVDQNKKTQALQKVIKINNPISVNIHMITDINKKTVNIKNYELNFHNNLGIAYSMYLKNVDAKGINRILKQVKQNQNNFMVLANIMGKVMQIKPVFMKITIKNEGVVDRMLAQEAKEKHTTKEILIKKQLQNLKNSPFGDKLAKPLENFLTSKSKKLVIKLINKNKLSLGDLAMGSKNITSIFSKIEIEFGN